ncbi:relaxase/mobilization nuclease domain-containing protein [Phocaeicola vulgatus]
MVAKITSGVSVYGALYYNQEKVDKGKARTLAWNRIMERPDGTAGIPECMRSFEAYLAANLRTEKPVIHLSLNPHPDDRLSDGQLEAIGREYMEKLGYGDQPYIIFRHEDNARPHIHIVSLRIDEQGRKIRDYKEWERSMKICRELEQKYGLVPSTKEERKASGAMTAVEYRKGDLKHQIANVVRPALQDYRFRSFREFKALLGLFNVTVEEVRKSVDGRTCHGLVYAALDEKGRRCGVGIKSSDIGERRLRGPEKEMRPEQDVDEGTSRTGKHKGGHPGSPASGHPAGIPPAPGRKRRRPHTLGKRTRRDLRGDLHRPRIKNGIQGLGPWQGVLRLRPEQAVRHAASHDNPPWGCLLERGKGKRGNRACGRAAGYPHDGIPSLSGRGNRGRPLRKEKKETETPRPAYRLKGFPKR